MSDILFIGKDLPDSIDFAEGLASINRNVFTTTKDDSETENFAAENIFSATWNKTSAISARAFLIKAETKFTDINEYLLFFDSYYYSTKFELEYHARLFRFTVRQRIPRPPRPAAHARQSRHETHRRCHRIRLHQRQSPCPLLPRLHRHDPRRVEKQGINHPK